MSIISSTFLLLLALTTSSAKRITCLACIDNTCYSRDTILKTLRFSGQLAIDRTSNIVYFHYQNKQMKDYTGAFDLDEVRFQVVPNLGFTFGHAVDQTTRDLYASGVNGIYRYNPKDNSTELYALKDKTIWHMQYKDKLYYNEFKKTGIYTYFNKKTSQIAGTNYEIDDFVIDKNNDIYFVSNSTTYVLKNGAKAAVIFDKDSYSMTTDKNGEAHFSQVYTKGLYKIDYRTEKLVEFGAFRGNVMAFVFDSDNHIIYYDQKDKNMYYLSPTLNRCTVGTKNAGKRGVKFFSLDILTHGNSELENVKVTSSSNNTSTINRTDTI